MVRMVELGISHNTQCSVGLLCLPLVLASLTKSIGGIPHLSKRKTSEYLLGSYFASVLTSAFSIVSLLFPVVNTVDSCCHMLSFLCVFVCVCQINRLRGNIINIST